MFLWNVSCFWWKTWKTHGDLANLVEGILHALGSRPWSRGNPSDPTQRTCCVFFFFQPIIHITYILHIYYIYITYIYYIYITYILHIYILHTNSHIIVPFWCFLEFFMTWFDPLRPCDHIKFFRSSTNSVSTNLGGITEPWKTWWPHGPHVAC